MQSQRIAVVLLAAVTALGLMLAVPGAARTGGPTLQQIFDSFFGAGAVDSTQDTGDETFESGTFQFTLFAEETTNPDAPIGWYPANAPTQFNEIFPADASPTTSKEVNIPSEFGLRVLTFQSWSSQASLNSDQFDHFKTFNIEGIADGLAVGIEDLESGGDNDFQDFVLFFAPPPPVVVLVHGYDGNSQDEECRMDGPGSLQEWLETPANTGGHAFRIECLVYRTHWGVKAGAQKLRDKIAGLVGVAQVDIVVHSMGGLVARYYIEKLDGAGYRARVRSLTMLATPNLGTRIAMPPCTWAHVPFTKSDQGACDSVPGSSLLRDLNISPGSHAGVQYQVYIGWLGLPGLLAVPNDCVVEGTSAQGLGYPTGLRQVLHVDPGVAEAVIGCVNGTGIKKDHGVRKEIAAILLASNGLSSRAQAASLAATTAGIPPPDEPAPSTLSVQTGLIADGETVDLAVAMPEGQATGTFVFRAPSSPSVTVVYSLLRPGGTPVAESDPDASVISGPGFGGFDETQYAIAGPEAGTWTMRIFGATVAGGGWPYDMQALVPGGISVVASAGAGHYTTGEPIALSTDVAIDGIPLSSATVNAAVTRPDGTTAAVELIGAGSGAYAGSFSDTAACGMYQVLVTASGLDGATPFTRQDRTLATVAVPGNVILDPCIADSDGDGLTDEEELGVYSTNLGDPDTDDDGCTDGEEVGPIAALGGQRDPLYYWDFMDMWVNEQKDRRVNIIDIGALVQRIFTAGDPGGDPLDPPQALTAYHVSADRSPPVGPNLWDAGPPDGQINIIEIGLVVVQFGHSCS